MIQSTEAQLAKTLLEMGRLDPDMLDAAIRDAHKSNERLEQVLVKMGLCDEEDVLQAIAQTLHVPFKKLADLEPDLEAIRLVQAEVAEHYSIVPVSFADGTLTIATSDPHDMYVIDELR